MTEIKDNDGGRLGKRFYKVDEITASDSPDAEEKQGDEHEFVEPRSAQVSPEEAKIVEWEDAMRASADQHGGIVPARLSAYFDDDHRLVRLADSRPVSSNADTESLLNGLIEDCRFLIREVAFQSARLTPDPNNRLQFLASAKTLAVTGAKVGHTIAELRGSAQAAVQENRYRMIVEHVQSQAAGSAAAVTPSRERKPARRGGGGRKSR